jgi:hypothetical protein
LGGFPGGRRGVPGGALPVTGGVCYALRRYLANPGGRHPLPFARLDAVCPSVRVVPSGINQAISRSFEAEAAMFTVSALKSGGIPLDCAATEATEGGVCIMIRWGCVCPAGPSVPAALRHC